MSKLHFYFTGDVDFPIITVLLKLKRSFNCLQLSKVRGTQRDKRSFSTSFFFFEFPKTSLILMMSWTGSVKTGVATFPIPLRGTASRSLGLLKKWEQPPRHDPSGMTPLLKKEGKVMIINTLTFSSSLRRSTPTVLSGGGGGLFQHPQLSF
jgi:hypothetical protein